MPQIEITQLEDDLGYKFNNHNILKEAMIHRSYINEHHDCDTDHNERLEFLGDAVLELVVTDYLFHNYKNPEGELTNWRAALVRGTTLKEVADKLQLGKYLYLSKGEELSGGRERELILANVVEALIGAIYEDQGYDQAKVFINKEIISKLPNILESKSYLDAKSRFQEMAQEKIGITPIYKLLSESGPDHAKQFLMAAFIGDKEYGQGHGSSKQLAEQEAAFDALEKWQAE
jgi:ribonuclease-3